MHKHLVHAVSLNNNQINNNALNFISPNQLVQQYGSLDDMTDAATDAANDQVDATTDAVNDQVDATTDAATEQVSTSTSDTLQSAGIDESTADAAGDHLADGDVNDAVDVVIDGQTESTTTDPTTTDPTTTDSTTTDSTTTDSTTTDSTTSQPESTDSTTTTDGATSTTPEEEVPVETEQLTTQYLMSPDGYYTAGTIAEIEDPEMREYVTNEQQQIYYVAYGTDEEHDHLTGMSEENTGEMVNVYGMENTATLSTQGQVIDSSNTSEMASNEAPGVSEPSSPVSAAYPDLEQQNVDPGLTTVTTVTYI